MKGNSCCKKIDDECQEQCKNLIPPKVTKNYINSNVQYNNDDWFNSITVNPWGIISLTEEPYCKPIYWVANNGSNTLAKYFHDGELLEQANTTGAPTGLVFNYTNYYRQYKIITVTLAGTIEGLKFGNASTEIIKFSEDAVYTGVALTKKRLYVCNFATGNIELYDKNFNFIKNFTDDALVASEYYPYNVAVNDKYVYVTFARKIEENSAVPGIGFGYIDKFSRDGQLLYRFIARDPLNAPWGLEFSDCNKYLYVGNNGDGKINIFDLCTGEFIGPLMDKNCNPVQIGNLWGLSLYKYRLSFAAGIDGINGLIGYLQFIE
jgi:uncharacterized protein (TIGR03118 family)